MRHVNLELQYPDGSWCPVGGVCEVEPRGSFSSEEPTGRQVYVFGFDPEGVAGVWRSRGGIDVATNAFRDVVAIEGLDAVSDLSEPHEMVRPTGMNPDQRIRLVLREVP